MKIKLTPVGELHKKPVIENVRAVIAVDDNTADVQYFSKGALQVKRVDLDRYSVLFYSSDEEWSSNTSRPACPTDSDLPYKQLKDTKAVRRIDDLGRVYIPKYIRQQLEFQHGGSVEFLTCGKDLIVRKVDVAASDNEA